MAQSTKFIGMIACSLVVASLCSRAEAIEGGSETTERDVLRIVMLRNREQFTCHGTRVGRASLVTAAHCLSYRWMSVLFRA